MYAMPCSQKINKSMPNSLICLLFIDFGVGMYVHVVHLNHSNSQLWLTTAMVNRISASLKLSD